MFKFIYKALLTLNSVGLLLIIYFIKGKVWVVKGEILSAVLYVVCLFALTMVCLGLRRFLSNDVIEGGIKEIEMANDAYLPSYLGYFFVALSIPAHDIITLVFVFAILFLFVFFSQTLYYNPLFLIFGYKFYYVTNSDDIKVFIISRQEICSAKACSFRKLKRINDFTFIDEEKRG